MKEPDIKILSKAVCDLTLLVHNLGYILGPFEGKFANLLRVKFLIEFISMVAELHIALIDLMVLISGLDQF